MLCRRLRKVPDSSATYKEQISKLSNSIKEVESKVDKKEAEAASLAAQLDVAKKQIVALHASQGKGSEEEARKRAQAEQSLADANKELAAARAKREHRRSHIEYHSCRGAHTDSSPLRRDSLVSLHVVAAAISDAQKANEAKAKADAEADEALKFLANTKKDKAAVDTELDAARREIAELKERNSVLERNIEEQDKTIAELQRKLAKLECGAGSAAEELQRQYERLKEDAEKQTAVLKGRDEELAKAKEDLAEEKRGREAELASSSNVIKGLETTISELREQLKTWAGSDKESLARLCRIRELEEQLRKEMADSAQVAGQRDSLR